MAAAVLLLHAGVLGLLPVAAGPGWQGQAMQRLQLRQIIAPPSPGSLLSQPAAAQAAAVPAATPTRPARAAQRAVPGPDRAAIAAAAAAPPTPAPEPPPGTTSTTAPTATPATNSATERSGGEAQPGGAALPVYATRLPPATQLRYELRRGAQRGHAVLNWAPDGERFELTLANEWVGGPYAQALGSASRGHLTASGLAPERHTESRRGRDVRAVNFQYDSARITFSGPSVEYPLVPGAQDRLSWMVQLAAIVEANPALQAPGSEVVMFVAGSRGDGEAWVFAVQDRDDIELPAGPLARPVHLKREPRRPYDTLVEVWLDPARGHLPARVRQSVRPTGQGTELLLETLSTP